MSVLYAWLTVYPQETNLLGIKGPRRMTVLLPPTGSVSRGEEEAGKKGEKIHKGLLNFRASSLTLFSTDAPSLTSLYRRDKQSGGVQVIKNKQPTWNPSTLELHAHTHIKHVLTPLYALSRASCICA